MRQEVDQNVIEYVEVYLLNVQTITWENQTIDSITKTVIKVGVLKWLDHVNEFALFCIRKRVERALIKTKFLQCWVKHTFLRCPKNFGTRVGSLR